MIADGWYCSLPWWSIFHEGEKKKKYSNAEYSFHVHDPRWDSERYQRLADHAISILENDGLLWRLTCFWSTDYLNEGAWSCELRKQRWRLRFQSVIGLFSCSIGISLEQWRFPFLVVTWEESDRSQVFFSLCIAVLEYATRRAVYDRRYLRGIGRALDHM